MGENKENKKSGTVAVVGRPSAGKSTLINRLCGQKVSIVSPTPQTTRNIIRGIVNREAGQLVLVDTPGRHHSEKKLNRKLRELSDRALADTDLAVYVLDVSRPPGEEEEALAREIGRRGMAQRTVAALNKTDLSGGEIPPAAVAFLDRLLPDLGGRFPISALRGEGVEPLLARLFALAPEGPALYGAEYYTDQELSFRIGEIIREQAIRRLREELPHALYVEVADAELREGENAGEDEKKLWVRAFILTERESQKGMVVGKGGALIKAIRLSAQKELNRIFDWKVELDLRVKTAHDWRHNDRILGKFFY